MVMIVHRMKLNCINLSTELPVGSKIKLLQKYSSAIADIAEICETSIDQPYISFFFSLIKLLFILLIIILLFCIFLLRFVLIYLVSLLVQVVLLSTQTGVGLIITKSKIVYRRCSSARVYSHLWRRMRWESSLR
jgi:hypothetical protein